ADLSGQKENHPPHRPSLYFGGRLHNLEITAAGYAAALAIGAWLTVARPQATSSRMIGHAGSISHPPSANRAEVGYSWWLLCRPSPAVRNAIHWRLVALLSKLRYPTMWQTLLIAELRKMYSTTWVTHAAAPHHTPNSSMKMPSPTSAPNSV